MALTRFGTILGIGASYVAEGYMVDAYSALMSAILQLVTQNGGTAATAAANLGFAVPVGSLPDMYRSAFGGSAALEAMQSGVGNYWVNNNLTDGPRLENTESAIAALSPKPFVTIYDHTQMDAISITNEADSYHVKDAVLHLLGDVRAEISAGNPNGQPIFWQMLGPRFPYAEFGEYWVRDREIEIVQASTRIYFGAETYAVRLDGSKHPSSPHGYRQLGAHTGRKIVAWMLDKSYLRGPSIAGAVLSGDAITWSFTVPAGKTLVKPATPDFFGAFGVGEARIKPLGYEWVGGNLKQHLPAGSGAGALKARYPARSDRTLNINNVVRLSDPLSPELGGDAIYPGEPGLVLESMKTISL